MIERFYALATSGGRQDFLFKLGCPRNLVIFRWILGVPLIIFFGEAAIWACVAKPELAVPYACTASELYATTWRFFGYGTLFTKLGYHHCLEAPPPPNDCPLGVEPRATKRRHICNLTRSRYIPRVCRTKQNRVYCNIRRQREQVPRWRRIVPETSCTMIYQPVLQKHSADNNCQRAHKEPCLQC